jgi:hypothetical protein
MNDFLSAYRNRCQRVEAELLQVAEGLMDAGCLVYANKNGNITYIKAYRENECLVYGFTDVPYRWYIHNSTKNGWSEVLVNYETHSLPAEEVMKYFGPSATWSCKIKELDDANWYLKRLSLPETQ